MDSLFRVRNRNDRKRKRRKTKRAIEVSYSIKTILKYLKSHPNSISGDVTVLEFGSGDGFQAPYLKHIGQLVTTDIYTSNNIRTLSGINFCECDITEAPFKNDQFDIIYSNHVIEHIKNIEHAFAELKRIGKPECLYAFSVPTVLWLLISIPAQYYNKIRILKEILISNGNRIEYDKKNKVSKKKRFFSQILFPIGHGVKLDFLQCYRSFRLESWATMFVKNGFCIQKRHPLLLYGPSELPLVPTTMALNKLNLYSSVLFILKSHG